MHALTKHGKNIHKTHTHTHTDQRDMWVMCYGLWDVRCGWHLMGRHMSVVGRVGENSVCVFGLLAVDYKCMKHIVLLVSCPKLFHPRIDEVSRS